METKYDGHTPEPWEAIEGMVVRRTHDAEGRHTGIDTLATIGSTVEGSPQANEHLIADAPALLRLLIQAPNLPDDWDWSNKDAVVAFEQAYLEWQATVNGQLCRECNESGSEPCINYEEVN